MRHWRAPGSSPSATRVAQGWELSLGFPAGPTPACFCAVAGASEYAVVAFAFKCLWCVTPAMSWGTHMSNATPVTDRTDYAAPDLDEHWRCCSVKVFLRTGMASRQCTRRQHGNHLVVSGGLLEAVQHGARHGRPVLVALLHSLVCLLNLHMPSDMSMFLTETT